MSKKRFNIDYNIGKAKYVINFHNGKSKHDDGSDFFDIKIFHNKKDLAKFQAELIKKGYVESNSEIYKDIHL